MHSNSTTMNYLKSSGLLPSLQSDFRPGNSTETAVLRVLSVLLQALDSGDAAALVLLDLSVAFDIVDYAILCRWLRLSFGLGGSRSGVVPVIRSWAFTVRRGVLSSFSVQLARVVCTKGSFLGPILFIIIYLLRHKAAQKHTKHTLCKKKNLH